MLPYQLFALLAPLFNTLISFTFQAKANKRGYIDKPGMNVSLLQTGKFTLQSDVYAFGVVLLENLTGRRALELNKKTADQNLILQFRNILNEKKKLMKVIDPEMARNSYTMETIKMFADLASRCVRIESNARPTMKECVKQLQLILFASMKV